MRQKAEESSIEARDSVHVVTSFYLSNGDGWKTIFALIFMLNARRGIPTRVHKRPELEPIQYPRLLRSCDMAKTVDWTLSQLQTQELR